MNDAMERTASSSLAIVEKKPQRAGGCIGIFFQLFDWNRRFANKKLFSKKLLPPVRLKQASKKFGGDEKQPKLRLIADENSGGFPNGKKNNGDTNVDLKQRHETRAPSLVARLMGLDSMPALQRGKSKKVPESGFKSDKLENGYQSEEWNVEKGGIKNESRPQKLQKTSCTERRPMTRFGADTLPFKSVLVKSKKHHQKLPVPVKSPRNMSRKNSSKLIGAATKILEPGLQISGSKCGLTYSNTLQHPPKGNTSLMGEMTDFLQGQTKNFYNCAGVVPKGKPSCRNCGNLVDDNLGHKPCIDEQPLTFASPSNCVGFSCQGPERSKSLQSMFYQEIKEDLHVDKLQPSVKFTPEMSSFSGLMQRHFTSQQSNPPKDLRPSLRSRHKTQNQNQISRAKSTVPPRSKFNNLQSNNAVSRTTDVNECKIFVLSNRSSSGNPRTENCKFEIEERISNRQNEFLPPGRKRRLINNIPKQSESSVFTRSNVKKQTCGTSQEDNNSTSFTSSSPAKKKNGVHAVEKRRVQNDACSSRSMQKSELSGSGKSKFDKYPPLSGDALGAILEQKLKELNSQGEDMGGNNPKKTTATILQELISALTSEIPFLQNKPEANAVAAKLSVDEPVDYEHLSPGSVLEVFSSESCLSSNHDDNMGYKMANESVDCCSSSEPRSINPDSEFSDSANSITGAKSNKESITDILNIVSETLSCINLTNYGLKGSNLDHTKEVLLNSELMFQNTTNLGSVAQIDSSIKHLLIDEMETLATVLWMNFGSSLGIQDYQEVNQLSRFAFDSIIDYLELRFERDLKYGLKALTKLPLCINTNVLLFEIVEEVRRWRELSRFVLDELIEMEMIRSLMEWTRCECEIFETGMEISKQVFQILLDEIVMDICNC